MADTVRARKEIEKNHAEQVQLYEDKLARCIYVRNKADHKIMKKSKSQPIVIEDLEEDGDEDEYGCEAPKIPRQKPQAQKAASSQVLQQEQENLEVQPETKLDNPLFLRPEISFGQLPVAQDPEREEGEIIDIDSSP